MTVSRTEFNQHAIKIIMNAVNEIKTKDLTENDIFNLFINVILTCDLVENMYGDDQIITNTVTYNDKRIKKKKEKNE